MTCLKSEPSEGFIGVLFLSYQKQLAYTERERERPQSPTPTQHEGTFPLNLSVSRLASFTPSRRRLLTRRTRNPAPMSSPAPAAAAPMAVDDAEDDQMASMPVEDVVQASRLLDNETRVLKASRALPNPDPPRLRRRRAAGLAGPAPLFCLLGFGFRPDRFVSVSSLADGGAQDELQRTNLEVETFKDKTKENQEKIKLNKQLPYLVGNTVEVQIFPYIFR